MRLLKVAKLTDDATFTTVLRQRGGLDPTATLTLEGHQYTLWFIGSDGSFVFKNVVGNRVPRLFVLVCGTGSLLEASGVVLEPGSGEGGLFHRTNTRAYVQIINTARAHFNKTPVPVGA